MKMLTQGTPFFGVKFSGIVEAPQDSLTRFMTHAIPTEYHRCAETREHPQFVKKQQ